MIFEGNKEGEACGGQDREIVRLPSSRLSDSLLARGKCR